MDLDSMELVEYTDEHGKVRMFVVDGAMQSATYIDQNMRNELNFEYMQAFAKLSEYHPKPERVLMIGAGMFSYPKYLIAHDPDVCVDALDPDEEVFDYACSYFYLDELIRDYDLENNDRLNFYPDFGRTFLEHTDQKYDIIINDAFDGFAPATDLCTVEASRLIHDHLKQGGMYLCNVPGFTDIETGDFVCGIMKTLKEVFPYVYAARAKKTSSESNSMNYIVVASDTLETMAEAADVPYADAPVFKDEDPDTIETTINWY